MYKPLLICLLALTSCAAAFAQADDMKPLADATQLKARLKQASEETKTIQANFTQVKHLSFMAEDITSSGQFHFKKDRMIRWEYTKPFEYIIVINGNNIYLKDDDNTSHFDAESNQVFRGINDMMVSTVNGDILSTGDFERSYFENDNYYLVILKPTAGDMKNYLSAIELYFNKSDMTLGKLKLLERSGDYTYIEYSDQQINLPLDNAIFTIQ